MKHTHSAGGVVLNTKGQVLIVNQRGKTWSLPKGHLENGEDTIQAAKREIYEETGVSELVFIKPLGEYSRYKIGKYNINSIKEFKTITLFLFTTTQEELAPLDPKHPEARWVEKDDVSTYLTHPKDKEFFEKIRPEIDL